MSLDVYLTLQDPVPVPSGSGIFVRDGGQTVEISREEWGERFPDREPVVVRKDDYHETTEVYSANITHNLGRMAAEADIYQHLWRPDVIGVTKARQLIEPLSIGVSLMKREPDRFIALNPPNGWGSHEVFVPWIERYLAACCEYPDADVSVWR
jgi:hypothetical protein